MEVTDVQIMHELVNIHALLYCGISILFARTANEKNKTESAIVSLIWFGFAVFTWVSNPYH